LIKGKLDSRCTAGHHHNPGDALSIRHLPLLDRYSDIPAGDRPPKGTDDALLKGFKESLCELLAESCLGLLLPDVRHGSPHDPVQGS